MPPGMVVPTAGHGPVGLAMTIWAGPIMNYADRAAADVIDPTVYIRAVTGIGAADARCTHQRLAAHVAEHLLGLRAGFRVAGRARQGPGLAGATCARSASGCGQCRG